MLIYRLFICKFFIYNLLIFFVKGDQNGKTFLFSVILSIYNTGKNLNDSVNSIINQSIDFEKNVQLILVNDGSIDNSKEICLKLCNKFPKNIIYVFKNNGGISSARNLGLKYA